MKKIKYLLLICLVAILGIAHVNAASFSVRGSTSNTSIGNTVSITVSVSGAAGWEYCINYNQDVFKLTSADSDTGGACVKTGSTLTGYAKVTFKFQTLKSGSGSFSVTGQTYDDDGNAISSTANSVNVNVRTKEEIQASLSGNNNLKSLEVVGYTLTPEFSKEITEYTLTVDSSIEQVQVNAYREDTTSSITPIDMVNLTEGINKVKVTLTAQNGNKKTYTITITKEEENPITVDIGDKKYTVVNKKDALEIPTGFIPSTIVINDKEVISYTNENNTLTLVILKDEDSNMNFFIYQDGKYLPFTKINSNSIVIVPTNTNEVIKGYENKKDIQIDDKVIEVYYKNSNDNIVLIYGKNIITGEDDWYYYDIIDGTILKYELISADAQSIIKNSSNNIDYKLISLVFAITSLIAIIIIIAMSYMNSRLKNKNEELYSYIEDKIRLRNEKKFSKIIDKEENKELLDLDKTNKKEIIIEESIENEEIKPKKITKKENKKKEKDITIISDTDIINNIASSNEEENIEAEKPKLSRKEEKLRKKEEKRLAKKARKEFLNDESFEEKIFDEYETESIPIIEEKKEKKVNKK